MSGLRGRFILVTLGLFLGATPCAAQRVVESYTDVSGFLRIGPEPSRRIPMTERGYSLLLPDDSMGLVKGVGVFVDPGRFQSPPQGFEPGSFDEGRWVTYLLETNLGGTPENGSGEYAQYSPFTHDAPNGGRAVNLGDIPLRAYHEPDVDWWIENRRKIYYDMNSIDLAALVNQLRILGNENAELVTTWRKRQGYADGATPHTWSIVDNEELVDWFLSHADTHTDPETAHAPAA